MDKDYGKDLAREHRYYCSFMVSTGVVVFLFVLALFAGMGFRVKLLIEDNLLQQARAHFQAILDTRAWNSDYGGVYVEKTSEVESNPYLSNPDLLLADGRVFTIKPPAVMTKEISQYAGARDLYYFKITSLDPLNPDNAPDGFERQALEMFEGGKQEYYSKEPIGDRTYFRYMAPLKVDESCLACHHDSNYKAGDIRGGISVNIDVGNTERKLKRNFAVIFLFGVPSLLALLSFVFYSTGKLIGHVNVSRKRIEELIITDELTGVPNRRHLLARFHEEFKKAQRLATPLGCVMLDLDHFKDVNDRFGHLVGDEVLRRFASLLAMEIRTYDVFGRLGGEEFLVVLPSDGLEEIRLYAERVRELVESMECDIEGAPHFSITVSAGITVLQADDTSIEDMLSRADKAMYRAKQTGRNRVC